jgi:hypothetical protein
MVSLVLKLFVSSRPLKLEGILCIYVFPYGWNTHLTFNISLLMIFCVCYFSYYNMVAKFYYQDYVFYAHV